MAEHLHSNIYYLGIQSSTLNNNFKSEKKKIKDIFLLNLCSFAFF